VLKFEFLNRKRRSPYKFGRHLVIGEWKEDRLSVERRSVPPPVVPEQCRGVTFRRGARGQLRDVVNRGLDTGILRPRSFRKTTRYDDASRSSCTRRCRPKPSPRSLETCAPTRSTRLTHDARDRAAYCPASAGEILFKG